MLLERNRISSSQVRARACAALSLSKTNQWRPSEREQSASLGVERAQIWSAREKTRLRAASPSDDKRHKHIERARESAAMPAPLVAFGQTGGASLARPAKESLKSRRAARVTSGQFGRCGFFPLRASRSRRPHVAKNCRHAFAPRRDSVFVYVAIDRMTAPVKTRALGNFLVGGEECGNRRVRLG